MTSVSFSGSVMIEVTGARGPRGFASGALGDGSVDADAISNDSGEQESILAKIGGVSIDALALAGAADTIGSEDGTVQDRIWAPDELHSPGFLVSSDSIDQTDDLQDFVDLAISRGKIPVIHGTVKTDEQVTSSLPIRLAHGGRVIFSGADTSDYMGVFKFTANNCGLSCAGSAVVECDDDQQMVYAAEFVSRSNVWIEGIRAVNCNLIVCWPGAGVDWADVNADLSLLSYTIQIGPRVSCTYDSQQTGSNSAAILLLYCFDWSIQGGWEIRKSTSGIQWWGGDANPAVNGAIANARWCGRGHIGKGLVVDVAAGVWGSMGEGIFVDACEGVIAGDVMFDAEGCKDVIFSRCKAAEAVNGCFTTFSYNRNIRFIDCVGEQSTRTKPLWRIYNSALSIDNDDIVFEGGKFTCSDAAGPGIADNASGPCRSITVRGGKYINTRITLNAAVNQRDITVDDNEMDFTAAFSSAAYDAISAAAYQGSSIPALVTIERNRIRFAASQHSGTRGIYAENADPNGFNNYVAAHNRIVGLAGGSTAIRMGHSGSNPSIYASMYADSNLTDGAAVTLSDIGSPGHAGTYTKTNNKTFAGSSL